MGRRRFPFATRAEFVEAIEAGGVAAMEVLARDLKSLGLYTARSLSYEGVEYELVEHALTPEQRRIYDAYAGAFEVLCAAAHKTSNREVAIMRRNATRARSFADLSGHVLHIILVRMVRGCRARRAHSHPASMTAVLAGIGAPTRSSAFRLVSRLAWA